MRKKDKNKEIKYLDSFPADTSVVSEVISKLLTDLEKMSYPRDEIYEIVLCMDEAITNAIQETIGTYTFSKNEENAEINKITIQYTITDQWFDATIIDHGKGFDLMQHSHATPNIYSDNYHEQIINYVSEIENKKLRIRLNGKDISLKGIGAGLKIILAFMDTLTIDLIDKKNVLSDSVSQFTDGTILTIRRKRRYLE